ncbi:universal stress protein [Pseudonocardia hispaniensis]|uniref:Universal stress protein n=1 Tax=Pseudonocardia hispaniensis TaxID=904933 RepID=A0ABW1J113_9PSEU
MSSDNRATQRPAPVVVGVDDEATTGDAVAWAAAEAAARQCPLRLVHALRWTVIAGPFGLALPPENLFMTQEAAQLLLDAAVARARDVASDLGVSTWLRPWPLSRTLVEESRHAQLLVLGGHPVRDGGRPARSATARIAATAFCPVAIVRAFDGVPHARSAPRVVVGVGGTPSDADALRFAFRAAAQRGIPLLAVHARTPTGSPDLPTSRGFWAAAEATTQRNLENALTPWRDKFADVPVIARTSYADPAHALVEASRGAALTVIGIRSRSHLLTTIGPVGRTVLRDAHGPIAVVRHQRRPVPPPTRLRSIELPASGFTSHRARRPPGIDRIRPDNGRA